MCLIIHAINPAGITGANRAGADGKYTAKVVKTLAVLICDDVYNVEYIAIGVFIGTLKAFLPWIGLAYYN